MRSDSPLTELSVEEYIKRSHILVSMQNDFHGCVDEALEQKKRSRQVIWSTSHFMAVPFLLLSSDCVALLPERMAQRCAKSMGLKLLLPPIDVQGCHISMVWHQRNTNSFQHKWLRTQLIEATSDI